MPPLKLPDGSVIPFPDDPSKADLAKLSQLIESAKQKKEGKIKATQPSFVGGMPELPGIPKEFGGIMEGTKGSETIKRNILPLGLGIAGSFTASPIAGGVAGTLLGEYLNKKLGINDPSLLDLVLDVVVPGGLGLFGKGLKAIPKHLPGASGTLHDLAIDEVVEKTVKLTHGKGRASILFKKAAREGGAINTDTLLRTTRDFLAKEPQAAKNPALQRYLIRLEKVLLENPNGLSPDRFHVEMSGVGTLSSETTNPRVAGVYKQIWKQFDDTLDNAAALGESKGASTLRKAINQYRKEASRQDIITILNNSVEDVAGWGGQKRYNAVKAMKAIEKNPKLQKTMSKEDRELIRELLTRLNKLPKNPVPPGVEAGSKQAVTRAGVGGLIGGAVGGATSGQVGFWFGSLIGGSSANIINQKVAHIMMDERMKPGLKWILKQPPGVKTEQIMTQLGLLLTSIDIPEETEKKVESTIQEKIGMGTAGGVLPH